MPRVLVSKINTAGRFEKLVDDTPAQHDRFVRMLADQSPPRCLTDREYLAGHYGAKWHETDPITRAKRIKNYRRLTGRNPPQNAVYEERLASQPGDPDAFLSGRGDLLRLARKRGLKMSGAVEYTPPELPPKPRVRLAEDVIQDSIVDHVRRDPALKRKPAAELREMVIEKHGNTYKGTRKE